MPTQSQELRKRVATADVDIWEIRYIPDPDDATGREERKLATSFDAALGVADAFIDLDGSTFTNLQTGAYLFDTDEGRVAIREPIVYCER